jgi:hypothetical protein
VVVILISKKYPSILCINVKNVIGFFGAEAHVDYYRFYPYFAYQ